MSGSFLSVGLAPAQFQTQTYSINSFQIYKSTLLLRTVVRYLNQWSCLDHVVSSPRKYFKWKSVIFMFTGVQSRQLSSDSNQNRLISVSRKFGLQMRTVSPCSSCVTQSIEFHFDFPYNYEHFLSTNKMLYFLIFSLRVTMRNSQFSQKEPLQDYSYQSHKVFWQNNF